MSWAFGLLVAAGFLVALQEAPSVAGVTGPPSGRRAGRVGSTDPARLPGAGRSPAGSMDPATGRPPPFDVGAVIEQVHFAFRPDGAGWRAGHSTWAVRYEDGALEVQPFHFPGGRLGEASPGATGEGSSVRPSVVRGDPIRLGSAEVTRGGLPLAGGAGAVLPTDRGQLDVVTGTVTERLRNGRQGVEQSWVFAEPPAGSGELVVRVPVTAGRLIGETEGGLHLSAGKLAVRYGHGTWVDAEGNRTAIPARWEGDAIALRVPAEVLEAASYPAVLDPVISPEIGMDEPVYGPGAQGEQDPAIAWGGTQYLVVWQDSRVDPAFDVFAARVDGSGQLLDPAGILVAAGAGAAADAAVAWNGADFLVVWADGRDGTSHIYGARISGAGVVRDPDGIAISTAAGGQWKPAVAADSSTFYVVWQDYRNGTNLDIYGARVSWAGVVAEPAGYPISTASGAQANPDIARDQATPGFLVAWDDYRSGTTYDIYGARLDGGGVVQDANGFAISLAPSHQQRPSVANAGAYYLVAWTDARNGPATDIYGARVTSIGMVVDSIGVSTAVNEQTDPAVVSDGANFFVVWTDRRQNATTESDIYGARVSSAGTVLDAAGIAISSAAGQQGHPDVAWSGSGYLAAWTDLRAGMDVYGARVTAAGAVADPGGRLISSAANEQLEAAVAWSGTTYLVAWSDLRDAATSGQDLHGARIDADGVLLDPAGIEIAKAVGAQVGPAIAWDGANFLAVWADDRNYALTGIDIYGARVTPGGELLDGSGFPISANASTQRLPAAASDGTNSLIVWLDFRNGSSGDVYGARVSQGGIVWDPGGILVSQSASDYEGPAVAWGGSSYLAVWPDPRNWETSYMDIFGARVTGAGAVLDPAGIPISTGIADENRPAVAWNGTWHLVAWSDARTAPLTGTDIYAARVSAGGVVQDPEGLPITTSLNYQDWVSVASDGEGFFLSWEDLHDPVATGLDLFGTRVTAAGEPLTPGGLPLSTSVFDEKTPRLAAGPPGRFVLASWSFDPDPELLVNRAHARTIQFALPTAAAKAVDASEDTPLPITLAGTSPDGGPLTYSVVTAPSHGTLSGTPPGVTYLPAPNYAGADSFTFRVHDGFWTSASATVAITVAPVQDPPTASGGSVVTAEDEAVGVTLAAADVDGDPLTWVIVAAPVHGALSGAAPNLTYTPAADYAGADSFTFKVNDGTSNSNVATIALTVTAVNDLPLADAQVLSTPEDAPRTVTLTGSDVEGPISAYAVTVPPGHGTLSGTPPNLTYTPAADYHGADAFTFRVTDGQGATATAVVSITVTPVNDVPVAVPASFTVSEDGSVAITLTATDADGDSLGFTVATPPAHGALTGVPPNLIYAPAANYFGGDAFTFTATDGAATSTPATVTLTISPVNDPPVATPMTLRVAPDTSLPITLAGTDPDANSLTFTVVEYPAHGTLTGIPPSVVYTPEAGYAGADAFTFRANDGLLDSSPATVSLTVGAAATALPKKSAYGCSSAGGSGGSLLLLGLAGLALARVRRRPGAALLALAVALPLAAQAAPAKEARLRVAVMPIKAGMGVEPKLAELVTDALVAELADRGLLTITSKDVETALGFARQKQMLGCGDDTCLAEIAGAMGADRVVSGDIAQVKELTVFSVQLFDTKTGTVEKRFHERMSGGEAADLLDATERAGAELFPGTVRAGRATRKKSVMTSAARPLGLFARGGYDVSDPGGFGLVGLEYRMGRTLRLAVGGLGTGAQTYGGALRAGWYPLALERLSIYGAAEAHLIFDDDLLVAAHLALGAEWAFSERFAMSVEVPLTLMASAPEEYEGTYFMPGLSASWRF